jgi:hypothetical protein
MINKEQVRAAVLKASLEFVPTLVRDSLLADKALTQEFGIATETLLSFGNTQIAFRRSKLFLAIRRAVASNGKGQRLNDESGTTWTLTASTNKKTLGVKLNADVRTIHVDSLILIAENKMARRHFFAAEAKRLNLPREEALKWGALIDQRPLTDEEVDVLMEECAQTPVAVFHSIVESLSQSKVSLDLLVPRSVIYYERLVGRVNAEPTIKEYFDKVAVNHIKSLLDWRGLEGLQYALLLGSHPSVTNAIARNGISAEVLNTALLWSLNADALSRGLLIELCLEKAPDEAVVGDNLRQLAETFFGQGTQETYDQFEILSIAFMMVYAEFGRRHFAAEKPVYWRRLAAFAHAALITRCILAVRNDQKKFVEWMRSIRSVDYALQCVVDLRTDPRWLSQFALPYQLKQELYGRVLFAATNREATVSEFKLREAIWGENVESLNNCVTRELATLPGPLEGNIEPERDGEADVLERMRGCLRSASPTISSFVMLLNIGHLFRIPPDIVKSAAEALERGQYRIDVVGKPEQLFSCLFGLAAIAASTRSQALADELFIVIRNYRRSFKSELGLEEASHIGLVACGSRQHLDEWYKCVGDFVSDLAFGEYSREEASALYSLVEKLCELMPELWAKCGQGLAAIESVALS